MTATRKKCCSAQGPQSKALVMRYMVSVASRTVAIVAARRPPARIMIGQNIGLTHLLPRAVAILETNPLAEGDCFAGDLLSAVLCAERSVIQNNAELLRRISAVAETVQSSLNAGPGPNPRRVEEKLLSEIAQFKAGAHGAC